MRRFKNTNPPRVGPTCRTVLDAVEDLAPLLRWKPRAWFGGSSRGGGGVGKRPTDKDSQGVEAVCQQHRPVSTCERMRVPVSLGPASVRDRARGKHPSSTGVAKRKASWRLPGSQDTAPRRWCVFLCQFHAVCSRRYRNKTHSAPWFQVKLHPKGRRCSADQQGCSKSRDWHM